MHIYTHAHTYYQMISSRQEGMEIFKCKLFEINWTFYKILNYHSKNLKLCFAL